MFMATSMHRYVPRDIVRLSLPSADIQSQNPIYSKDISTVTCADTGPPASLRNIKLIQTKILLRRAAFLAVGGPHAILSSSNISALIGVRIVH